MRRWMRQGMEAVGGASDRRCGGGQRGGRVARRVGSMGVGSIDASSAVVGSAEGGQRRW